MKPSKLSDKQGLPPIVSSGAKLLILGSMPGDVSLHKQQYYGHPRNAFWAIMAALFDVSADATYGQRQSGLMANGIAVWDVLHRCRRIGSLDAAIDMATFNANNFADFFALHTTLKAVCFNGRMAENLYKKHVFPTVQANTASLAYISLPSTSPAYAAMTVQQKIQAWQAILPLMVK